MSERSPEQSAASRQPPAWRGWALFAVALLVTFALGMLGASILQRREEARPQAPLVPIAEFEVDSGKWRANHPRQYDSFRRTSNDRTQTKYGGGFPRDYLEETPANVVLFAGYGFSKEYRQARGHWHSIEDVTRTQRLSEKTPATCWTCKSPDVPRLLAEMGPAPFYAKPFQALKDQVTHAIGCLDCHKPDTMQLTITRPALREAWERMGKGDVEQASHQEMRSLVCAQCHVEYYFKPEGSYLAFPWDKGTRLEDIEAYYDEKGFADWTHAVSKAKMVKIQHSDYEVYLTGVHAYRNVSCADCHMPYRTEGGVKLTDHHVQSPLLNIASSCAVCHRWSEQELRDRVAAIQDKVREGRDRAEGTLSRAHLDIAAARQAGAGDEELQEACGLVRKAQIRWDFVAATNGMGFHSPQESMRVLTAAVDYAGQCRVDVARILARHGVTAPVQYPAFDTKEKAQATIKAFAEGHPPALISRTKD